MMRRGGVGGILPPLLLTMEEKITYLQDRGQWVGYLFHHKDEEYDTYSITRQRGGVLRLLFLFYLQLSTRHIHCTPAYNGGWEVGHLLQCKEERRSMLRTPSCASSTPCTGVMVIQVNNPLWFAKQFLLRLLKILLLIPAYKKDDGFRWEPGSVVLVAWPEMGTYLQKI